MLATVDTSIVSGARAATLAAMLPVDPRAFGPAQRRSGGRDRRRSRGGPSGAALPYNPATALGTDLALWMDEGDATTLRATSGGSQAANLGTVQQILDKSSYLNHAAISAGTKPTRADASVNGQTSLLYVGTEAKFQTASPVPIGSTNTLTYVEVSKLSTQACDCMQHSTDSGGISKTPGSTHQAYYDDASGLFNYQQWTPGTLSGSIECNVAQITLSGSGDTSSITTNGIVQSSTPGVSTPAGRVQHTGPFVASQYWIWGGTNNGIPLGNACEILIILRALTGPELTALLGYLRPKWGFP